jgi:hypothetical protein
MASANTNETSRALGLELARRQERGLRFVAAFFAWVSVALIVAGAPVAQAAQNEVRLAVSATVVDSCKIATQPMAATEPAPASALDVACGASRRAQPQIAQSEKRMLRTAQFEGEVMLATVNF